MPQFSDIKNLLMGQEDWGFLLETILRSFIMFIIILVGLRLLGKRGVKQLSVFELVVIIGLGSAAGDPMFYKEVGILPAVIVFIMIISLYSLITRAIAKSRRVEKLVEGKPICLIKNGIFSIENFKKEILSEDEFFSELRLQGISQLGQIEEAIVETSGSISVFFYADEEVKYGLPIMPDSLKESIQKIEEVNYYSCTFCGYTEKIEPVLKKDCTICSRNTWVRSSKKIRVN